MKRLVSFLIYWLNEKVTGRRTFEILARLQKEQWYSTEQLKKFHFRGLERLTRHAAVNVEAYRQRFTSAGFNPDSFRRLEDFQKVPLLNREDIRPAPERFIAKDKNRKMTKAATSGSPGRPLIFFMDNDRKASARASHFLLYDWWGIKIGDREAVFWGHLQDFKTSDLFKRIRDKALGTQLLPAFQMGEKSLERHVDFLKKFRPRNLFGYAHAIYLLARFAKNRSIDLTNIGIKAIFTTAETLHDYQRQLIEEVFGAPVANSYGARDAGHIAFECPSRRMHLNPEIYTEFIKDGAPVKPGEKGEVVVTDLRSYGMPFIRYRTGDEAILDEDQNCPCGRKLPVVKKILGRDKDYVVTPQGELVHPLGIEYIFREIEGIDYFKVVQKKEDLLSVQIVAGEKFKKEREEEIRTKISALMKAPVTVDFSYISPDEIPSENKYKFVVSEVVGRYLPQA